MTHFCFSQRGWSWLLELSHQRDLFSVSVYDVWGVLLGISPSEAPSFQVASLSLCPRQHILSGEFLPSTFCLGSAPTFKSGVAFSDAVQVKACIPAASGGSDVWLESLKHHTVYLPRLDSVNLGLNIHSVLVIVEDTQINKGSFPSAGMLTGISTVFNISCYYNCAYYLLLVLNITSKLTVYVIVDVA